MTAFRITDPAPQFFSADGTFLLVGGTVTFYESGTTTLQDTYTDISLSVANSNPMPINSQGRISDAWGSGNYRMVVADSFGNIQYTRDDVEIPGGSGQTLPALVNGEFLTNDGTNLLWQALEQIPDVTGQSGNYLSTNGTDVLWVTPPAAADPAITVTASSLHAGSGTSGQPYALIQAGNGSAPASGNASTSTTITFPTPYGTNPYVIIIPTTNTAASAGVPTATALNVGTNAFEAYFNNAVNTGGGGSITGPVTFTWIAFGSVST